MPISPTFPHEVLPQGCDQAFQKRGRTAQVLAKCFDLPMIGNDGFVCFINKLMMVSHHVKTMIYITNYDVPFNKLTQMERNKKTTETSGQPSYKWLMFIDFQRIYVS